MSGEPDLTEISVHLPAGFPQARRAQWRMPSPQLLLTSNGGNKPPPSSYPALC